MSKKIYFLYRILFLAVVCSWVIPDFFDTQPWALPLLKFWDVQDHYLALLGWAIFDLGCTVGSDWQKRQHRKRCTLRHGDDPKRHNFVFVSKSDNKLENYKHDVIENINQEIKK